MTSLVERAVALRDLALLLVKKQGSWHQAGPARLLMAEEGDLMIAYRSPFQKVPPVSASVECGAKPFAIDVWHNEKSVLFVEWDEEGATDVVSYRPGDWEHELKVWCS
jgi:hypothetical protein